MSKHLFIAKYITSFPGSNEDFDISRYYNEGNMDVLFGKNGRNFDKWFSGKILAPENPCKLSSSKLQRPASETDFIKELNGIVRPVSLVSVYFLISSRSPLLNDLNVFFSQTPGGDVQLLALFKKYHHWYVHGYGDEVRQSREWRTGGSILTREPL